MPDAHTTWVCCSRCGKCSGGTLSFHYTPRSHCIDSTPITHQHLATSHAWCRVIGLAAAWVSSPGSQQIPPAGLGFRALPPGPAEARRCPHEAVLARCHRSPGSNSRPWAWRSGRCDVCSSVTPHALPSRSSGVTPLRPAPMSSLTVSRVWLPLRSVLASAAARRRAWTPPACRRSPQQPWRRHRRLQSAAPPLRAARRPPA